MSPSGPGGSQTTGQHTPRAIAVGIVVGIVIAPAMLASGWSGSGAGGTWLGLPIFGSVLAAGLAAFLLRIALRSRRVGEHACAQTLATSIVAPGVGLLLGVMGGASMFEHGAPSTRLIVASLASVAGCLIALSLFGPLRRAAIDAADLPFPSGRAGATIGRGGGVVLLIATLASVLVSLPTRLPGIETPAALDQLDALVRRERLTIEDALRTRMIAGFADARTAPSELAELGAALAERADAPAESPEHAERINAARAAWADWLAQNTHAGPYHASPTPDELALRVHAGAWDELRSVDAGWAGAPLFGYADLGVRVRSETEADAPRVDFAFNGVEADAPPRDAVLTRASDRDHNGQADLIVTDDAIDVGRALGVPSAWPIVLAIAPFALGAGLVAGTRGLWIASGGVLAWLVLSPIAFHLGYMPASVRAEAAGAWSEARMHGPIGLGVLLGGGLCVAIVALRAMTARDDAPHGGRTEPAKRDATPSIVLAVVGVLGLAIACGMEGGTTQGLVMGVLGAALVALACVVVAPTRGLSDWTPLVPVAGAAGALSLMLSGSTGVALACACGAAAVLTGGLLSDGVTGHFAGVRPRTLRWLALAGVVLGAAIGLGTLAIGADHIHAIPARLPLLEGAFEASARSGQDAGAMVVLGAIVGGLLGVGALAGLGVLIGAGMCMPIGLVLTFTLGCIARGITDAAWARSTGASGRWAVRVGAGLMLGQGLVELGVAVARIALSAH